MLTLVLQINRTYEYLNGGIRHDFLPGSLLNERYGILMLYWAVLKYSVIRLTRSIWLNTLRSQQQSCKLLALWKKAFGHSLFIKKRFMLDEKLKQNASKFVIFHIYKNPKLIFDFMLLYFSPNKLNSRAVCTTMAGHIER